MQPEVAPLTQSQELVLRTIYRWEQDPFPDIGAADRIERLYRESGRPAKPISPVPDYLVVAALYRIVPRQEVESALRALKLLGLVERPGGNHYSTAYRLLPHERVLLVEFAESGQSARGRMVVAKVDGHVVSCQRMLAPAEGGVFGNASGNALTLSRAGLIRMQRLDSVPEGAWRLRPFDPDCTETVPRDDDTFAAIRSILPDWDGRWEAVYDVLRAIGYGSDELAGKAVLGLRTACATRQQEAIRALGGQPYTHPSTITTVSFPPKEEQTEAAPPPRKQRAGRLKKEDSETKRTLMLALLRQHPTMRDDPDELAQRVGVSHSSIRRWLGEEEKNYLKSRVSSPDSQED